MTSQAEQKQTVESATAAADAEGLTGEPVSTGRLQDGRFPPGVSGNPAGRLPGTKNRATKEAEELLEGEAEALARKAVELALAGDTVAPSGCAWSGCCPRAKAAGLHSIFRPFKPRRICCRPLPLSWRRWPPGSWHQMRRR
jgi:hypothetical protein